MTRYLPPRLLSQIPIDGVPTNQVRDLIQCVVAKCDDVLTTDGAIHPTLIRSLASEAARELAAPDPAEATEGPQGPVLTLALEPPTPRSNTESPKRSE